MSVPEDLLCTHF